MNRTLALLITSSLITYASTANAVVMGGGTGDNGNCPGNTFSAAPGLYTAGLSLTHGQGGCANSTVVAEVGTGAFSASTVTLQQAGNYNSLTLNLAPNTGDNVNITQNGQWSNILASVGGNNNTFYFNGKNSYSSFGPVDFTLFLAGNNNSLQDTSQGLENDNISVGGTYNNAIITGGGGIIKMNISGNGTKEKPNTATVYGLSPILGLTPTTDNITLTGGYGNTVGLYTAGSAGSGLLPNTAAITASGNLNNITLTQDISISPQGTGSVVVAGGLMYGMTGNLTANGDSNVVTLDEVGPNVHGNLTLGGGNNIQASVTNNNVGTANEMDIIAGDGNHIIANILNNSGTNNDLVSINAGSYNTDYVNITGGGDVMIANQDNNNTLNVSLMGNNDTVGTASIYNTPNNNTGIIQTGGGNYLALTVNGNGFNTNPANAPYSTGLVQTGGGNKLIATATGNNDILTASQTGNDTATVNIIGSGAVVRVAQAPGVNTPAMTISGSNLGTIANPILIH